MRSSRGCHGENVIFHFNGAHFCVPLLRSRTFLAAPSSPSRTTPFICFFSLLRSGILHRGPFIRGPVLVPCPFPPLFLFFLSLLLLLASASSTASFYLGANVLIACGRSSRLSRFPPSPRYHPPLVWLLSGHRPPKLSRWRYASHV